MAFSNGDTNGGNGTNEAWKAHGFLNFYLPANNASGRKKLGAIPLKKEKPHELALSEALAANPEMASKILAMLEVEYQAAEVDPANGFDLAALFGGKPAPEQTTAK